MMTADVEAGPEVLEFGRYRLLRVPDGRGALVRAHGTCETCQHCGCGERAEQIELPAALVKMMLGEPVTKPEMIGLLMQMGGSGPMGFLRRFAGRELNGDGSDDAGPDAA